jgi:Uma2 family endonuclease
MPYPKEKKYTADEFFLLTPEDSNEKYELYKGNIVLLAAPSVLHQRLSAKLLITIGNFINSRHGKCEIFAAPFDVKLDDFNVVQPDISVICDPSKLDDKRCNGSPDFVIEITSSNRSNDFTRKVTLYEEYGVREYWIVDTIFSKVVVYHFEKNFSPSIYTFEQDIPVNIYGGELTINIADLLA